MNWSKVAFFSLNQKSYPIGGSWNVADNQHYFNNNKKNRICKIELHILKEKNAWMNFVFQLCKCVHQVTMLKNVFSSC